MDDEDDDNNEDDKAVPYYDRALAAEVEKIRDAQSILPRGMMLASEALNGVDNQEPGILVLVCRPRHRPRIVKTLTGVGYLYDDSWKRNTGNHRSLVGVSVSPDTFDGGYEDSLKLFQDGEIEFVDADHCWPLIKVKGT